MYLDLLSLVPRIHISSRPSVTTASSVLLVIFMLWPTLTFWFAKPYVPNQNGVVLLFCTIPFPNASFSFPGRMGGFIWIDLIHRHVPSPNLPPLQNLLFSSKFSPSSSTPSHHRHGEVSLDSSSSLEGSLGRRTMTSSVAIVGKEEGEERFRQILDLLVSYD